MRVSVNIDVNKILSARGLGPSKKAQKFLASDVVRLSDPYVPMQQGALKNQNTIASDGSQVVYTQPYAHYQYYGKAMAGRPPKSYTGEDLKYSGGALRGARWTERMVADKKAEIIENVNNYIARKGG